MKKIIIAILLVNACISMSSVYVIPIEDINNSVKIHLSGKLGQSSNWSQVLISQSNGDFQYSVEEGAINDFDVILLALSVSMDLTLDKRDSRNKIVGEIWRHTFNDGSWLIIPTWNEYVYPVLNWGSIETHRYSREILTDTLFVLPFVKSNKSISGSVSYSLFARMLQRDSEFLSSQLKQSDAANIAIARVLPTYAGIRIAQFITKETFFDNIWQKRNIWIPAIPIIIALWVAPLFAWWGYRKTRIIEANSIARDLLFNSELKATKSTVEDLSNIIEEFRQVQDKNDTNLQNHVDRIKTLVECVTGDDLIQLKIDKAMGPLNRAINNLVKTEVKQQMTRFANTPHEIIEKQIIQEFDEIIPSYQEAINDALTLIAKKRNDKKENIISAEGPVSDNKIDQNDDVGELDNDEYFKKIEDE